jgi:hypothetical protein
VRRRLPSNSKFALIFTQNLQRLALFLQNFYIAPATLLQCVNASKSRKKSMLEWRHFLFVFSWKAAGGFAVQFMQG